MPGRSHCTQSRCAMQSNSRAFLRKVSFVCTIKDFNIPRSVDRSDNKPRLFIPFHHFPSFAVGVVSDVVPVILQQFLRLPLCVFHILLHFNFGGSNLWFSVAPNVISIIYDRTRRTPVRQSPALLPLCVLRTIHTHEKAPPVEQIQFRLNAT